MDGWMDGREIPKEVKGPDTLANQADSFGAASHSRWKNTTGFACRTTTAERGGRHAKRTHM